MHEVEFRGFGKIKRDNPFEVTITEKIDGTNACVIVADGEVVGVQSRRRLITVEDDNYGFAAWVEDNKEELANLGDGYHYGEWAGPGIQKNNHVLVEKTFFLFNTGRWAGEDSGKPSCCETVPVIHEGEIDRGDIEACLKVLQTSPKEGYVPEGIVVYYHAFRKYTKHTIESPAGKWARVV